MAAVGGNITRASHGNFVQVVPPLGVGIRLFGQGAFWCLHRIEPCLRMVRVSWQFKDHDSQCIFWNKTFMVNPFYFFIVVLASQLDFEEDGGRWTFILSRDLSTDLLLTNRYPYLIATSS